MREYIYDYVGRFIELHKQGDMLTALCPFHEEKTPSFVVDQEKLSYRCFGCGAEGHVEDLEHAFVNRHGARNA